jgi:hypothetical protein
MPGILVFAPMLIMPFHWFIFGVFRTCKVSFRCSRLVSFFTCSMFPKKRNELYAAQRNVSLTLLDFLPTV